MASIPSGQIFLQEFHKVRSLDHVFSLIYINNLSDNLAYKDQGHNVSFHHKLESIQFNIALAMTGAKLSYLTLFLQSKESMLREIMMNCLNSK